MVVESVVISLVVSTIVVMPLVVVAAAVVGLVLITTEVVDAVAIESDALVVTVLSGENGPVQFSLTAATFTVYFVLGLNPVTLYDVSLILALYCVRLLSLVHLTIYTSTDGLVTASHCTTND